MIVTCCFALPICFAKHSRYACGTLEAARLARLHTCSSLVRFVCVVIVSMPGVAGSSRGGACRLHVVHVENEVCCTNQGAVPCCSADCGELQQLHEP